MISFLRSHKREFLLTVTFLLVALLVCCAIVLVGDYSDGMQQQAQDAAKLRSQALNKQLNQAVDAFVAQTQQYAKDIPYQPTQVSAYLYATRVDDPLRRIAYFRYAKDGKIYEENGAEFAGIVPSYVTEAVAQQKLTVTGLLSDRITDDHGFFVCVPISGNPNADMLIAFYHSKPLYQALSLDEETKAVSEFAALCSVGGTIEETLHQTEFDLTKQDNLFLKLRVLTDNKSAIDLLEQNIHQSKAHSLTVSGEPYVISFDSADASNGLLYTVSIYRVSTLYAQGHQMVSTVYSILLILSFLVLCLVVYIVVDHFRVSRQLDDFETSDPELGCPTYRKFISQSEQILSRNKITKFAVIYVKVVHFDYIETNFGTDVATDALKFIAKMYEKTLSTAETFCRVDRCDFALLLHYRQPQDLYNRQKVLNAILYNCPRLSEYKFSMKVSCGLCFVDREQSPSVPKLLDCAILAERSTDAQSVGNLRIYDQKIQEIFAHEAEIESKMEGALKNGEFKVFFQPKYHITQDRTDGAEALARWYDAENGRFRQPVEFIPLFEANGFIANLDKYVFVEVCKYFRESIERGYKLVPISVNVSRVTAIQEDFLDFYISNKKKYGVADHFLMLEFTESFAYENYDILKHLVEKLHENGFLCSLDDFGSGYSSFHILKELPMDELKLDRCFIQPGISRDRDNTLLQTMISLGKTMGMTVTQEGVETEQDLARLESYGCDLVQGYVYSKPLSVTDYIAFIQDGRLHRNTLPPQ